MSVTSIVRRLSREPTLRFLFAGSLVFALYAIVAEKGRPSTSMADAPERALFEAFSLEHGRAPNPNEREALLEGWADEQALLRYAYELELHRADAVVRRRLVQDVELLLEAEAEPVTQEALRARYARDQQERFTMPTQRSFAHRYFAGRNEASLARAQQARHALRAAGALPDVGDPYSAGTQLPGQTQRALSARFGEALAARAFALEPGAWSEPLPSPLGYHLLRVTETLPQRVRPFDEVRAQLRSELEAEQRARAIAEGKRDLRERYANGAPP